MTECEFKKLLKEDIFEFSDKEWQYNTWTVFNSNSFYDPVEQIVDFFDGRDVERYVKKPNNCLTDEEREGLEYFICILNQYIDTNRDVNRNIILDAKETYYSPEWENICQEAKRLYNLMNKYDTNS